MKQSLGGLLLALCATSAVAQSPAAVRGFLVHGENRTPIEGARVTLIGTPLVALTDPQGRFDLEGVAAGTKVLQVRAVGYVVGTWLLTLHDGQSVRDTFSLEPIAITVESVTLRADNHADWRSEAGFDQRRLSGNGQFFTRDDIRRRQPRSVADLLRTVPGVITSCRNYNNVCSLQMTQTSRGVCQPEYFLDGHPATYSTGASFPLDVSTIRGVEVYRNEFEAPVELQRLGLRCGVVAIWTIESGERFDRNARP